MTPETPAAHRTRLNALLDPADWPAARARILDAARGAGLPEPAVAATEQHGFCEPEDVLTAQWQAAHDGPPVSEVVHLIDVDWPAEPGAPGGEVGDAGEAGGAADVDRTALVAGALPGGAPWYGTTVEVRR